MRCGPSSNEISCPLLSHHFSLTYVGFSALEPNVIYGVTPGTFNARPADNDARLQKAQDDYVRRLQHIENEETLGFNTMTDWGEDGRIKASAPSHSPFIRHTERLDYS